MNNKNKVIIAIVLIALTIVGAFVFENTYYGMRITILGVGNLKEQYDLNAMGYIITTNKDNIIVVDGGRKTDKSYLLDAINKYTDGTNKIKYWFITHPHDDHVGALAQILEDETANIFIENICYHFNSYDWYIQNDPERSEDEVAFIKAMETSPKIQNRMDCKANQGIITDNLNIQILRVARPDAIGTENVGNDSSMVFKVTDNIGKSMLFLGDGFEMTSQDLLENCKNNLPSYAVQMAHHGQNGVTKEVYMQINPKLCFFNCPEWLYNNDNGTGYNTGTWKSIEVREWVEELGAESILGFNGDQTVVFTRLGHKIVNK